MRGEIEAKAKASGLTILGVDEVGRGCLAGPVFAACVAIDYEALAELSDAERNLLRDSKKLSAKQRQAVQLLIARVAKECFIGSATEREIETKGIVGATFLAMHRSIAQCKQSYGLLLVDGNQKLPDYNGDQQTVVGGDNECYAIAAASIIAKEARDLYMREQAEAFPVYGFDKHVGYGTKQHLEMIALHGICHLHRRNFAPITRYV